MPSVSSLDNYNFSPAPNLADTSFLPPIKSSQQVWQRFLQENSPNDRVKRSDNSENQNYTMKEETKSWRDFYTQAEQEERIHLGEKDQTKPLVTNFRIDANNTSLFIPGSPLDAIETTIDALLKIQINAGDTAPILNPFERITIANHILHHQGENAENLLFYESFYSAIGLDQRELTQSHNQLHRIMAYLDRIKKVFSLEMLSPIDLWIQARSDAILHNANIDFFEAFLPCKKILEIKGFTAVFKDYKQESQGSPLPILKVRFKFHHYPRVCQMQSGRSFLVLPNGEIADYDVIRKNDHFHPAFWNHLAFALKILPILPRQVIQEQADEGKFYSFLGWEPKMSQKRHNHKSIRDYVEKGIRFHREEKSLLKKTADLILPQEESELKGNRANVALAYSLHVAGVPWGDKSKTAILHGVEAMEEQSDSGKWWEGMEGTFSTFYDVNQTSIIHNSRRSFSLQAAQNILDTAKRTKVEGFLRLIREVRRLAYELYPEKMQEPLQIFIEQPAHFQTFSSTLSPQSKVTIQKTTETSTSFSPTSIHPIAEANFAVNASLATMSQLLYLRETLSETSQELLAMRNSIVHSIQTPLQYERVRAFVNLEISNWAKQTSQTNLTRSEIVDSYLIEKETSDTTFGNLTLPNFITKELLEPLSNFFGENVTVNVETPVIPDFRAENIESVLNEDQINLQLDVQWMAESLLQDQASIQPSSNNTFGSSLFTVCVEAVKFLAGGAIGDDLTPTTAIVVRNQILNRNSTLYSPSSATALLHLESHIWAIESQNEHLSNFQRSHAYLDRLNKNDPFQPITGTSDIVDNTDNFEPDLTLFEKGSLHRARARAFQVLLGEEAQGLSQMDMVNEASTLLNSEKEDYDEDLAREFTKLEAEMWAEEALSGDLTEEEIFKAYLFKTSYLANPPKIPEFQSRRKIAEKYVEENYPAGRYYDHCRRYKNVMRLCSVKDRVKEALDWGGTNGVDSRYNSQLNSLLSEGPHSIIALLAKENFGKVDLPYSELVRPVQRIWVIEDFAPLYFARTKVLGRYYFNDMRHNFQIHRTGVNIYSSDPILFETAKGRFGIVLPNGEISLFDQSPLTPAGKVSHSAIAIALGLGDLDGLAHTYTWPNGVSVKRPFKGWTMSVNTEDTLVPLQTLIERNIRIKLEEAIGDLEKAHYSPTGFQSLFFAIVPFLNLILDNANGAHSEIDVTDLIFDIFDLSITLISLGIPITKAISGSVKAVRIATKGLLGAAKTRAAIRAFSIYMAKTKYTKKIAKEAIDFFIPVFTAHDLLRLQTIGTKKLIDLVRKKTNDLLESRGLTGIRTSHIICRRSPTLACGLTQKELMEQLGKALSETEEPAKDALFEQTRKTFLHPQRSELKKKIIRSHPTTTRSF